MKLFIANKNYSSWSLRPWILMQELEIPFEEKIKPLEQGTSWTSYRDFSPSGTVPCLLDGETTVWDSLAIVEYLAEDHPQIWPEDKVARAWARCATAEMHSGFFALRNNCPMTCGLRIEFNEINSALQKDLNRIDELWTQGLNQFDGEFLAGDSYTAVDAFFAPVIFRIQTYGLKLSEKSMDYMDRMLQRESMQSWYQAGIAETWREPIHEDEFSNIGKIIKDMRAKQ